MGINARFSDTDSDLIGRATANREDFDRELCGRVRAGSLSVIDYLTRYKGFRRDHAEKLVPRFEKAIFCA